MLTCKEQIAQDNAAVFQNPDEFADMKRVSYNEAVWEIPVVLDHEITTDRKIPSGDNAKGIFLADVRAYINERDMGVIPRKGKRIKFGTREYKIAKVSVEMGVIILDLEAYGE
jgi:hypothetical protein